MLVIFVQKSYFKKGLNVNNFSDSLKVKQWTNVKYLPIDNIVHTNNGYLRNHYIIDYFSCYFENDRNNIYGLFNSEHRYIYCVLLMLSLKVKLYI